MYVMMVNNRDKQIFEFAKISIFRYTYSELENNFSSKHIYGSL